MDDENGETMIDLRLGDCLYLMRELPDASVDAVITDPPYNVGLKYSNGDDRLDYKEWCQAWFSECLRISGGLVAISCGIANLMMWESMKKPDWILAWLKQNAMGRCAVGWNTWEPVLLYGKIRGKKTHDHFVANFGVQTATGSHPCPKPIKWGEALVDRLTQENDTVFDPFMGSGTTGIACIKLNRNFIGIEISEDYFAIAQRRIADAQKQMTMALA